MKTFIILFILIVSTTTLMAQEAGSLYLESLKLHLDYLSDLDKGTDINTFFIEADIEITNNLPQKINGKTVKYLNRKEIRRRGKKSKFHLIVIRNLELKQDKIEINIIDFMVDYKRQNFNYSNTGGSKLIFKYDCEKSAYILYKKEQGGI